METTDLNNTGSQDAFVSEPSLVQLDPSPIESPNFEVVTPNENDVRLLPEDEDALPDSLKSSRTGTTTSTVGLSGTGHSAIYYLTRIQRYSSYTLTIFTTLHLATTGVIPLLTRSVPSSESYLLLAREIYQTPLSEPLLVALPAVAHIASGLALRLLRRNQNVRRYGRDPRDGLPLHRGDPGRSQQSVWPPLSWISVSGYVLTATVGLHAFVNRVLPLLVEGDSANIGLAYVSHGFARHPVVAWATYGTMLVAGCGHMVWGWARWLGLASKAGFWAVGTREVRKKERRTWLAINGAVVLGVGLWAAGGLGVVARGGVTLGWVGKVYDGLFDRIPLL